jgi:hypothetical protein
MAVEALPNLSMPHGLNSLHSKNNWEWDTINHLLNGFASALNMGYSNGNNTQPGESNQTTSCLAQVFEGPPFMITIARSASDGFTPCHLADKLQTRILQCIHDRYCSCSNPQFSPSKFERKDGEEVSSFAHWNHKDCRLHVLYDYGEWEGSSLQLT